MAEHIERSSLPRSQLQILKEDVFQGETIDPVIARHTEVNFYRGAEPQWLNFYLAEQGEEENRFIKRDGYDKLHDQILSSRSVVSHVRLKHEQGSGGTTLAMQLLWDLRRKFRCAVLVDPDVSEVATEVIKLYTDGESHKTVLLLVQREKQRMHTLREGIVEKISQSNINPEESVVIILDCERVAENSEEDILLRKKLSGEEMKKFDEKKEWLLHKYGNAQAAQFHGFNIMQNKFSKTYVKTKCDVFNNIGDPDSNPALKLSACMCLLNTYVPGSFLLKSHCEAFLKAESRTYEEIMKPFSHLMVSFTSHGSAEQHVRMAHPMIAEQGTLSLHDAGVDRSAAAHDLLSELCQDVGFITDMLTKREDKTKDQFSRLISDMNAPTDNIGKEKCVSILKKAAKTFKQTATFPQTLSRFYYLQRQDYYNAEIWAKKAKEIAPHSSFVADTLGQVYKHHLNDQLFQNNLHRQDLSKILDLAEKAFEAFQQEEELAENEHTREYLSQESQIYNYYGKCAYVEVANNLFFKKSMLERKTQDKEQTRRYKTITFHLKTKIKERSTFLSMLLGFSDKSFQEDPPFVLEEDNLEVAKTCYKNYTGEDLPKPVNGKHGAHLRFLHENWPRGAQDTQEVIALVKEMECSYKETKEKYFRDRHLLPLRSLDTRVQGEVRSYNVYTTVGGEEIKLSVGGQQRPDLFRSGPVTFQLGFTIRGPTAYKIEYED